MKDSIVQNIAHKLFLARSDELEYELVEHEFSLLLKEKPDGYYLKDNRLIFSSYEDRNFYIAHHHFSEIDSDNIDAGNLIILTAFNIWKNSLRGDQSTAGLFLSLYEDKIDIWQALLESERNLYEVSSLADQFIKHIKEIDIQALFTFFSTVYKRDNQYIGIYSSLEQRLTNYPKKCHEIINKYHLDINPDTRHLYNIALFSLKKENYTTVIDILLCDIAINDSTLSSQSLWVLGKIVEKNHIKYREGEIIQIIKSSISSPISTISNAAVQAAVDTVDKSSEIRLVIRDLIDSNNQKVFESLSKKLYTERLLTSHTDFPFWMSRICEAAINNNNLHDLIFNILSFLSKDESKHELLTELIFIMIKNNSILEKSQTVETFLYNIVKYPNLINELFTLSLVGEKTESTIFSCLLATHLFVHRSEHILECSLDTINNFTEKDFIFLVRRILGFISNEEQLTSLTLSLLKVKNSEKRTYSLVKSVVVNEIAVDYPGHVISEIKHRKENIKGQRNKLKKLYNEMLTEIDSYITSLTAIPRIKELEPSSMLVRAFQKEKDKVMARKNDLWNEDSLVSQIASRINLKAGIGSFYYNDYNNSGYSEPSYLHTFSSSYSLPRRYVMDNVGYDIYLAQFRCAKKDAV